MDCAPATADIFRIAKSRKTDEEIISKNIGNYIVDFFIASKRVVIEIDGLQHTMIENQEADKKRDEELQNLGIKVLRYTNFEINNNFNTVCNDILKNLGMDASDLKE